MVAVVVVMVVVVVVVMVELLLTDWDFVVVGINEFEKRFFNKKDLLACVPERWTRRWWNENQFFVEFVQLGSKVRSSIFAIASNGIFRKNNEKKSKKVSLFASPLFAEKDEADPSPGQHRFRQKLI